MKLTTALLAVALAVAVAGAASANAAAPTFSKLSGAMAEGRFRPAAVLLPNGTVLIVGGANRTHTSQTTAEVFDPATGAFTKLAATMTATQQEVAAAPLPGGKVLIVGGYSEKAGKELATAEIFNPLTNTFEAVAATMATPRDAPGAAELPDGKVLVVGGADESTAYPTTGELYDPATGKFEVLASHMLSERYAPGVATLANGEVLITGGYAEKPTEASSSSAELFNPATNSFEPIEGAAHEMKLARSETTTAVLQNGNALVIGGYDSLLAEAPARYLASFETFSPASNAFETAPTALTEPRGGAVAVTLPSGVVLVAGGYNQTVKGEGQYPTTAEERGVGTSAASTSPASGIGETGATLSGAVTAEAVGTAGFQYGTSTAYGAATASQSMGASLGPLAVSASLAGLAPNTTYHYRLVTTDAGGTAYGADMTFTTAMAPPVLTAVAESRRTWREGSALARMSRHRRRAPVGTTFSFGLDQAATVTLEFTQRTSGRTVGHRCVAQARSNRRRHRCTRTVERGTLTWSAHTGANHVVFDGRISRSQRLGPGSYTVIITARNAAAQASASARLSFTVVR